MNTRTAGPGAAPRGRAIPATSSTSGRSTPSGAPSLVDSLVTGYRNGERRAGERRRPVLVFSAERGVNAGLYVYDLTDPRMPVLRDSSLVASGIHTATIAEIGGRRYVFAAQDPVTSGPAADLRHHRSRQHSCRLATVPMPPPLRHPRHVRPRRPGVRVCVEHRSHHLRRRRTAIQAGSAAMPRGGEPTSDRRRRRLRRPVGAQRVVVPQSGLERRAALPLHRPGGRGRHRLPIERRHPRGGRERPGPPDRGSRLPPGRRRDPQLLDGRERQILYAAYYNGGVVALDVSGQLAGDLSNRLIAEIRPGGAGATRTWGVQLAGGSLYAIDMLSGLWQPWRCRKGLLAIGWLRRRRGQRLFERSTSGYHPSGSIITPFTLRGPGMTAM